MNWRDNMRAGQKNSSHKCFYFSDHRAGRFLAREGHLWGRLIISLDPYSLTLLRARVYAEFCRGHRDLKSGPRCSICQENLVWPGIPRFPGQRQCSKCVRPNYPCLLVGSWLLIGGLEPKDAIREGKARPSM